MLMSSTLVRDSSSVLRSRPIGLPRYQVNEMCGPMMPPFCSHWHPAELRPALTRPRISVSWLTVWSLTPPHSGKNGPCEAFLSGVDGGDPGLSGPDALSLEQPASNETTVAMPIARKGSLLAMACRIAAALRRGVIPALTSGFEPRHAADRVPNRPCGVRQYGDARGTAAHLRAAVPRADRERRTAAGDRNAGVVVPADRQRRDHR